VDTQRRPGPGAQHERNASTEWGAD
jgi:hypothetical protein